jgi:hypothetical protein
MATAIPFDTYKAVSSLQKRGLSKDAAEGITDLLKDVTENNLVTKDDLKNAVQTLDSKMKDQSVGMIKWITGILIAHAAGTAALTVALLQLFR